MDSVTYFESRVVRFIDENLIMSSKRNMAAAKVLQECLRNNELLVNVLLSEDELHKEKNMTSRLPYIGGIKVLPRDLINGKNIALNRPWSNEVEILLSSTQGKRGPAKSLVPRTCDQSQGDSYSATGSHRSRSTLVGEPWKRPGRGAQPLQSGPIGKVCRSTQPQREDTLC